MSDNEKQAEQAGKSETSLVQERLNWKLAQRDDARVAQGLYAGEEIEEMHQLSDAGLLDEFFVYLEEIGMMEAFEQIDLPGGEADAGANGAICAAVCPQSALWQRVDE